MALTRKCKGCGKPFEPSRSNQRYHTEACRKGRYDRTRAGKARKIKYSTSLLGTIAQVKYDSSESGQERKTRYRGTHPKLTKHDAYFSPTVAPTNRKQAEAMLNQPENLTPEVKRAAKKLLKPIYARRDKSDATSRMKFKMVHDETLRLAAEKEIRPEESFELLKQLWTDRGINPRWWFNWERFCSLDEWEELQIHNLESEVQDLATEKSIPFDVAMVEYKKGLVNKLRGDAIFRADLQGRCMPGGEFTSEQFNNCVLDVANSFAFQWAGGVPTFAGLERDYPKPNYRFRRVGHSVPRPDSVTSTTD